MVSIDLTGKVAVITGGNRGIGRGIATTLAQAGEKVAIVSCRGEECRAVADELTKGYRTVCVGYRADVEAHDEIPLMTEKVDREYGG